MDMVQALSNTIQNLMRDIRMWDRSFSEYIKQVFMEDEWLSFHSFSCPPGFIFSPNWYRFWVTIHWAPLSRICPYASEEVFIKCFGLVFFLFLLFCFIILCYPDSWCEMPFIYHWLILPSLGEENKGAFFIEVVQDDNQGPTNPFPAPSWRHQAVGHSAAVLSIVVKRTPQGII